MMMKTVSVYKFVDVYPNGLNRDHTTGDRSDFGWGVRVSATANNGTFNIQGLDIPDEIQHVIVIHQGYVHSFRRVAEDQHIYTCKQISECLTV
jgi:hypothetical protein